MSQLRGLSHKRSRLFLLVCTNMSQWFWAKWCPLMTHVEQRVLFMFRGRKKSPFPQNHLCYRRCFSCIYKITIARKDTLLFLVNNSIREFSAQKRPIHIQFLRLLQIQDSKISIHTFFVQRSFKCGHQTLKVMTRRQNVYSLWLYYMHNIFIFDPS